MGSTLESIVFVGDSAGALTNESCVIKCIESGIRVPDRLLNIYGITRSDFVMTPSRFLSIVDAVLPYLTTCRIIITYASDEQKEAARREMGLEEFDFQFSEDYVRSPYIASDEILKKHPPTSFIIPRYDPCQDDSIEFGKKLKKLGVEVTMKVIEDSIHGFLYYTQVR